MAYPYSSSAYQGTQFFPQPQGNVYIINNSMEPAYITCSPYQSANNTAYNPYGCACNS